MNCVRCGRHVNAVSLGGLRIDYARCPHCRQAYVVASRATPTIVGVMAILFAFRLPDAWMAVGLIAATLALLVDWQYVAIDESAVIVPRPTRWLRGLAPTREKGH